MSARAVSGRIDYCAERLRNGYGLFNDLSGYDVYGGLSLRLIAVGFVGLAALAPLVWRFLLPDFLKERFLAAQHPEQYLSGTGNGWQQYLGRNALGSGLLSGRGLFSNSNLVSVPEAHNDFIFSYIGQTMGFVGCILTLLLLTALCVRILMVARMSKDVAGMLICSGVFAMLFFQIVVNIGMVLCILPVVGVTLPFFQRRRHLGGCQLYGHWIGAECLRKNKKTLMFD